MVSHRRPDQERHIREWGQRPTGRGAPISETQDAFPRAPAAHRAAAPGRQPAGADSVPRTRMPDKAPAPEGGPPQSPTLGTLALVSVTATARAPARGCPPTGPPVPARRRDSCGRRRARETVSHSQADDGSGSLTMGHPGGVAPVAGGVGRPASKCSPPVRHVRVFRSANLSASRALPSPSSLPSDCLCRRPPRHTRPPLARSCGFRRT